MHRGVAMIEPVLGCGGAAAGMVALGLLAKQWMVRQFKTAYREGLRALAEAVESKDPLCAGHADRCATVASKIARELGFSGRSLEGIEYAALLQDVGNAAVPRSVLTKPGRLTQEEFELVKVHPSVGSQILQEADQSVGEGFYRLLAPIILSHHERVDGKGYPEGRGGNEIPIGSKVLALATSYSALTAPRAHRPAYSPSFALRVIRSDKGTKFDPEAFRAFSSVMARVSPSDLLEARL
jgi:HD-GYP domain-containing protein (c-di-GMP phosphodiesterase class II)